MNKPTLDEILVTLLLGESVVDTIDNWQAQADNKDIQIAKAAIKDWVSKEIIGEDNPHSPDAEAHIDSPEYKYACCERVQANNRLLELQRKKLKEM